MSNPDIIDDTDYKNLLLAIFKQALDDYIKLQHPKYRQKQYLLEAFFDSRDMFFDDDYRMLYLKNDNNEDMSLKDLLTEILGHEVTNLDDLRNTILKQTKDFWDDKPIRTLIIPDTLQIDGHVYEIVHTKDDTCEIDFDKKIIYLNKLPTSENEEKLVNVAVQLTLHHEDITITRNNLRALSKAWFRTLKVNNCFIGCE